LVQERIAATTVAPIVILDIIGAGLGGFGYLLTETPKISRENGRGKFNL
jgi:hypothetical protein